jgi:hypothetical protein
MLASDKWNNIHSPAPMEHIMKRTALLLVVLFMAVPAFPEDVDLVVVHRIKAEAFQNSKVMDHLFLLTDLNGSRLSGSPGLQRAAEAVADAMRGMEIESEVEIAGKFGRSWSYSDIQVRMLSPVETPLSAVPMAWSRGTDGAARGPVVMAPLIENPEDAALNDLEKLAQRIEAYKTEYAGKLAGRAVLIDMPRKFTMPEELAASRFDDEALGEVFMADPPGPLDPITWPAWKFPLDAELRNRSWEATPLEIKTEFWERELAINNRLYAFLAEEGVVAILKVDDRGDGGAIFNDYYGSYHPGSAVAPPTALLMPEQYNRLIRLVERDVPVELEVRVAATIHDENADLRNVVATIPGSRKRNEIVMLGGHLDSWHGAVGATDNASGSAVVMEAMRILKTLDLKMDRTVRMALWDGEEQNYYGSRAYVKGNFADPLTMRLLPDHARLSAYYNIDTGSGKIRGVYLQSNDMARPIFKAWFAPFVDMGVTTISIRNDFGTDHLPFDAVGLPGFSFIQDPLEYQTRTHHSDLDTVDHVVPGDLMQAAAVLATVVYHTANRPEMMPRKSLPGPLPEKQEVPEILQY